MGSVLLANGSNDLSSASLCGAWNKGLIPQVDIILYSHFLLMCANFHTQSHLSISSHWECLKSRMKFGHNLKVCLECYLIMDRICKFNQLWAQRATQSESQSILALHSHLTAQIPYSSMHGPPFGRSQGLGGMPLHCILYDGAHIHVCTIL